MIWNPASQADSAGLRLLPISAIYGPNASGKTNLFKALQLIQGLVVQGTRPAENIPVQPFRLDRARLLQPSRFSLEFLAGGKVYLYRFAATSREVLEESLTEVRAASDADELDRSFHSGLTRTIIESFLDAWDATSCAQLLFTTHDVTLIDQELFRRDELWLVEKNDADETELKSVSDYQIRSDKRLMKDYLHGRFGAVPPGRILPLRPVPPAKVETEHEAAAKKLGGGRAKRGPGRGGKVRLLSRAH